MSNFTNWASQKIIGLLLGLVVLIIIYGVAAIFSVLGRTIRGGRNIREGVNQARREFAIRGEPINQEKVNELYSSANRKIFLPILSLLVFYIAILVLAPQIFFPCLLALILVFFGYHGVFFLPGLGSFFNSEPEYRHNK
jgi:hypothetical protein